MFIQLLCNARLRQQGAKFCQLALVAVAICGGLFVQASTADFPEVRKMSQALRCEPGDLIFVDLEDTVWWSPDSNHPELVDRNTPQFIHEAQEEGCIVIGLTGMPYDWARQTHQRLQAFAIAFSFGEKKAQIAVESFLDRGVIFTNTGDKGEAIVKFLGQRTLELVVKRVVLIDNSLNNLKDADRALTTAGIAFIGRHYTAAKALAAKCQRALGGHQ